jgi:prolyl-tRNA synthetase
MKDAYSFHADDEDLAREYRNMFEAYTRIFRRLGLKFRAVEADTGSIGGRRSHEFHVLADSGEDVIAWCGACDYAANVEMAATRRDAPAGEESELDEVATPGVTAAGDVARLLGVSPEMLVKTLVLRAHRAEGEDELVAVCLRGDDELQEMKLTRLLNADEVTMASEEEIAAIGGVVGFVGPAGLEARVIADERLRDGAGLVAGANRKDAHVTGLSMARDVPEAEYADLRMAREGDACPRCGGEIRLARGIEVGHVFELGRQYAEPMGVVFQNEKGERTVATMGCYGIGISRLVAAVVEQCHDEAGIVWPMHLAPFHVTLVQLGRGEAVAAHCHGLYESLTEAGLDVLWDERNERPGVKFRDAELLGIPVRVALGERGLASGTAEVAIRGGEKLDVPLDEVVAFVLAERDRRLA